MSGARGNRKAVDAIPVRDPLSLARVRYAEADTYPAGSPERSATYRKAALSMRRWDTRRPGRYVAAEHREAVMARVRERMLANSRRRELHRP